MGIPTYLVILGVSKYRSPALSDLPAAVCDALSLTRALLNWGCDRETLHLFLDQEATYENVLDCFDQLTRLKAPFKLVFYFAGHASRLSAPSPSSYLLFQDSQVDGNKFKGALCLDELVALIGKMQSIETYLFIDACSLRINSLKHPLIEEEAIKSERKNKSFFCMLSSGIDLSYESRVSNEGYYTRSLLKVLAEVKRPTISEFVEKIRLEMASLELPLPEMYNIQTERIECIPEKDRNLHKQTILSRKDLLREYQNVFSLSEGNLLLVYGYEGVGKSHFAKQLEFNGIGTAYFSWSSTQRGLLMGLQARFSLASPDLKEALIELKERFPWVLLILDRQGNDLADVETIIDTLQQLQIRSVFFLNLSLKDKLRRDLITIPHWKLPALSKTEALAYIKSLDDHLTEEEAAFVLASSGCNPQKIQQIVQKLPSVLDEVQSQTYSTTIQALFSVRGYLDEDLFIKIFGLKKCILEQLKALGLLVYIDGRWEPQKLLSKIIHPNNREPVLALRYWLEQLKELPDAIYACKSLVELLHEIGYQKSAEPHLKEVFSHLKNSEDWEHLCLAAKLFIKSSVLTDASLYLATILCKNPAFFQLAKQLTNIPTIKQKHILRALLIQTHCQRREGDWEEIQKLSHKPPQSIFHPQEVFSILLERALALFQTGQWPQALREFEVLKKKAKTPSQRGIVLCMTGTLIGFMDAPFDRGIDLLLEGVRTARKDNETRWLGYNNLGELYWHRQNYEKSLYYLEKALSLARGPNAITETKRNLIELIWRMEGINSLKIENLLNQIDLHHLDQSTLGYALNTLASAYYAKGEFSTSLKHLKRNIGLKLKDSNCRIYTLANVYLHLKGHRWEKKGGNFLENSRMHAKLIGNRLAQEQLNEHYNSLSPPLANVKKVEVY